MYAYVCVRQYYTRIQVPRAQRSITFDVLEGEHVDNVAANTHLGTFKLSRVGDTDVAGNADPGYDSEVSVEVKLGLDADGVIEASVRDMQSGKTKTIKLNRRGT